MSAIEIVHFNVQTLLYIRGKEFHRFWQAVGLVTFQLDIYCFGKRENNKSFGIILPTTCIFSLICMKDNKGEVIYNVFLSEC